MRVTMKDVAQKVGVSSATVSLVLNRKENRIPDETKQKIFDAARELGYETKRQKSLVENKYGRNVIAVIYSEVDHALSEECLKGIEEYAYIYEYSVIQFYNMNSSAKCIEQIWLAASLGAAGIILIPPTDMNTDGNNVLLGKALKECGVPFMLLDRAIYEVFCDFVTLDNKLSANMATEYLISHGHREVGLIVGKRNIYNTRKRVEGFAEALTLNGIEHKDEMLYFGEYQRETGYQGAEQFCRQGIKAIVSCNAETSLGIYAYAKEHGLKIGEDLSLINVGNMREAKWLAPALTCIFQPGEQMGRKAAEVIIKLINNDDAKTVKTNYFTPYLVEGESVKDLRG